MNINSKRDLRERMLTLLRKHKEEDQLAKSLCICAKLLKMQEFNDAKVILFYASFDGEVGTFEMIKKAQELGKKVALPKMDKERSEFFPVLINNMEEDLCSGAYGIQEPCVRENNSLEITDIELVIVPGVAFDKQNNRLGRGFGYYDRFLTKVSSRVPSIGLAFDFQMVELIPQQQEHDVPVTCVLTN